MGDTGGGTARVTVRSAPGRQQSHGVRPPLLWGGLLLSLFSFDGEPLFADLRSSVIGAAAGFRRERPA